MSYNPTILIRKSDLSKHKEVLTEEQYSSDEHEAETAKELLLTLDSEVIKFGELELVTLEPDSHVFNNEVRIRLTELNVEFKTI